MKKINNIRVNLNSKILKELTNVNYKPTCRDNYYGILERCLGLQKNRNV